VSSALNGFEVAYSIKANPSVGICRILRALGVWAEIASGGELLISQSAGFSPDRVIFAGPAKQEWELRAAVTAGIGVLNVESWRELELLHDWQSHGVSIPPVCIRVNTYGAPIGAGECMVGGSSRFGFDEELLVEVLQKCGSTLRTIGVHVYSASQVLDQVEIATAFDRTIDAFLTARRVLGSGSSTIVFGGGFGVPNSVREPCLDLNSLGAAIASTLERHRLTGHVRCIVELGRFLVASSGVFITRVIDVKQSRGTTYVLTDGGINNFLRPAFMRTTHPVCLLNKLGAITSSTAHVGGPLCTPLDEFASSVALPVTEPGDLIGVFNAGAYGYSMSTHQFLGHVTPAEILIDTGSVTMLRPKGELGDLLRGQN
jgi:diaminopimelate decarboxylase